MWRLNFWFFPLSLCLLTLTTRDIERAFLQNKAELLSSLCRQDAAIQVSLPDPISFSDILTAGQTRVFFGRLFASYPTFEFLVESPLPAYPPAPTWVIQSRWSFLAKKNLSQHVLRVYFLLKMTTEEGRRDGGWKIIEIRAEKI